LCLRVFVVRSLTALRPLSFAPFAQAEHGSVGDVVALEKFRKILTA
jgi:hypothetical protein